MDPRDIARLITEDPDVLAEAACPSCGNKRAYIGFSNVECPNSECKFYSEKQAKESAEYGPWQLKISVPAMLKSIEVYYFEVIGWDLVKRHELKKRGTLLTWSEFGTITGENYFGFEVGFDNKEAADKVHNDLKSKYGSDATVVVDRLNVDYEDVYNDSNVDKQFQYKYHMNVI